MCIPESVDLLKGKATVCCVFAHPSCVTKGLGPCGPWMRGTWPRHDAYTAINPIPDRVARVRDDPLKADRS